MQYFHIKIEWNFGLKKVLTKLTFFTKILISSAKCSLGLAETFLNEMEAI